MKWFLFGKREKLPLFDGTHSEKFWATRDTEEASSAPDYWEQRRHPSRTAIADVIAVLEGDSLLEIGVHAGPTLWAIAQKKRFARLAGTDLSETVLDFTRRNLPDVELFRASADKLPFPDKSFDIVVTAGVLVCIGPEAIEKSLSELARVSRRYIVLCEPATGWRGERTERYSNTSYWVRDYGAMMEGRARVIKRLKLPRKAVSGHLNSIRVLELLPLGGR